MIFLCRDMEVIPLCLYLTVSFISKGDAREGGLYTFANDSLLSLFAS